MMSSIHIGSNHLQDVLRTIVQGAKNSEPAVRYVVHSVINT